MESEEQPAVLRIGELSRRVGVSDHVLRAWESRYGLLRPARSTGRFRLYSEADERRVRRMQTHLARGLSAAQAAQAAILEEQAGTATEDTVDTGRHGPQMTEPSEGFRQALDDLDEPSAHRVLDRLLADYTLPSVLRDVVTPYLHELGERWEQEAVSVAQEHFASNLIRGRLAGLARGWGSGHGPCAVLACPPDELHDLALMIFGIVLNRSGWRVTYLGMSTPIVDVARMIDAVQPDLVVLAATTPDRFTTLTPELSRIARMAPLGLAGAGATQSLAVEIGARLLTDDPVTAAERLSPPPR